MTEPAIQLVLAAYKYKQSELGRDLKPVQTRHIVNQWVSNGRVPAHWIIKVVRAALKRDEQNIRKTLPDECTLIKRMLRDHELAKKQEKNDSSN